MQIVYPDTSLLSSFPGTTGIVGSSGLVVENRLWLWCWLRLWSRLWLWLWCRSWIRHYWVSQVFFVDMLNVSIFIYNSLHEVITRDIFLGCSPSSVGLPGIVLTLPIYSRHFFIDVFIPLGNFFVKAVTYPSFWLFSINPQDILHFPLPFSYQQT